MTVHYTDPFGPPWKLPWLRMMTQWQGSIFQFLWVEFTVALAIYTLVLSVWYMTFRDTSEELTPEKESLFSAFSFVTARFQAAISLMLGFYTSTIYTRWWKVRDVEGVVIGRVNDLSVQIAALVRDEPMGNEEGETTKVDVAMPRTVSNSSLPAGENASLGSLEGTGIKTASHVRMNLVRWLNLAHALGVGDLYEKQPNEFSSLEDLLDFGLLSSSEYEYLKSTTRSRYQVPFIWFLNLVHELKDKGYCGISDGTLIVFCENVTRIRGSLADLYMYRNVPVPLSYRQLCNWTVRLYIIIFAVAGALGSMLQDDGNLGGLTPSVFFLLIPFAFEYFMFVGWLSLADALGNPFRAWADEFEYENYVKGVALASNHCITTSRDACTHLDQVDEVSRELEKRQEATLARWDRPTQVEGDDSLREKLVGL